MPSFIPGEAAACPGRGPRAGALSLLIGCAASVAPLWGCSGEITATAEDERRGAISPLVREVAEGSMDGDALRGGRLYDRFYEESDSVDFEPDDPDTVALDGAGGPDGDGTLRDGRGQLMNNALGHSYRLKNFFGWDLRGAEGVYGPAYQNQSYVVGHNLLGNGLSRLDVTKLIVEGAQGVPAYGQVMPAEDLADLVAFVMAVREHDLPRPSDIWRLEPSAPKGYVLASGGNAQSGMAVINGSCSNCHGASGTALLLDDGEHSLGTLSRTSAYEVWFKIVAGNPGTPMGSQVPAGQPGPVMAQHVLDVLAALCDRTAFPRGDASEEDVGAGDLRCGSYLR